MKKHDAVYMIGDYMVAREYCRLMAIKENQPTDMHMGKVYSEGGEFAEKLRQGIPPSAYGLSIDDFSDKYIAPALQ